MDEQNRLFGTVTYLNDRQFGFIKYGKEKSCFFHSKNLKGFRFNDLTIGTQVEFEETETERGLHAINILIVEDVS